jgi:hypothetical protein
LDWKIEAVALECVVSRTKAEGRDKDKDAGEGLPEWLPAHPAPSNPSSASGASSRAERMRRVPLGHTSKEGREEVEGEARVLFKNPPSFSMALPHSPLGSLWGASRDGALEISALASTSRAWILTPRDASKGWVSTPSTNSGRGPWFTAVRTMAAGV